MPATASRVSRGQLLGGGPAREPAAGPEISGRTSLVLQRGPVRAHDEAHRPDGVATLRTALITTAGPTPRSQRPASARADRGLPVRLLVAPAATGYQEDWFVSASMVIVSSHSHRLPVACIGRGRGDSGSKADTSSAGLGTRASRSSCNCGTPCESDSTDDKAVCGTTSGKGAAGSRSVASPQADHRRRRRCTWTLTVLKPGEDEAGSACNSVAGSASTFAAQTSADDPGTVPRALVVVSA